MDTNSAAQRLVSGLAAEGLLVPGAEDRALAVLTRELSAKPVSDSGTGMPKLTEVVAYLGAALVLAAGLLFALESWDRLTPVGHILFLLGIAVVLGVAGAISARNGGALAAQTTRRLTGTMLTGAALAAGFAVAVGIDDYSDHQYRELYWPALMGGIVVAAGSAIAYRVSSTAVGLLGMLGGALVATSTVSDFIFPPRFEPMTIGLAFVAVSVVWLLLTERKVFDQPTVARALGVTTALFGAQLGIFDSPSSWIGYLLTGLVAAAAVWLYVTRVDWPYVAVAVVAVTLVVPEMISDWTDDSLGAVGGVLVAGITLLVASFAGYRLHRSATD